MLCSYDLLSNNKNGSKRIECVSSKKRQIKLSLDKSRTSNLSDSSRKFIQRKTKENIK